MTSPHIIGDEERGTLAMRGSLMALCGGNARHSFRTNRRRTNRFALN
jgi:hypothetical protein